MKLIKSKSNDRFQVWNLDKEIESTQVRSNLMRDLGLLDNIPKNFLTASNIATIPRLVKTHNVLTDIPRGTRPQTLDEDSAGEVNIKVPRFAATATILPADLKGKIEIDDFLNPKNDKITLASIASVMNPKVQRIKETIENTWEAALFNTLRTGVAYAPNGTIVNELGQPYDFYAIFGGTRQSFTVDALDPDADVESQIEVARAWIQDNLGQGTVVGDFVALCGTTFFTALSKHPEVRDAIKTVGGGLAKRLLIDGKPSQYGREYRQFEYGGVVFIEDRFHMTGLDATQAIIIAKDATDMVRAYYATPEDKFDLVNSTAKESYVFRYDNLEQRNEQIVIDGETLFLFALTRPNAVQRLVLGTAVVGDGD